MVGIEPEVPHEHVWTDATCESAKTCECGETEGEALGHKWTDATCAAPKTCSVCNKTEGNALKHDWAAADCENAAKCKLCGEISGEATGHTWIDATCTSAKYCITCNKTEGTPAGHNWMEATCVVAKTCSVCGTSEGVAKGHSWNAADCDDPATCVNCGATEGVCTGHNWTDATCVLPKICLNCGSTDGEALGHNYGEPTCEAPKTCSGCGHTVGDPLGHDWSEATCVTPSVCNTCGKESGVDAAGHDYADATCVLPKTCKLCGGTDGEALGHTGGTATCNALAVCDVCGEDYGEYDAHSLVITEVTCACSKCAVSFTPEEYKYMNGATKDDFVFTKNGAFGLTVNENGEYVAMFSPEQTEVPADSDFEQKDGKPTGSYKGWAYYNAPGAQHMFWIPSNANGKGLQGFSCANNATGVVSFKIKTNVTNGYYVSFAKERSAADWSGWGTSELKVLYIDGYKEEGIVVKGGINAGTALATIPVADGWSEWFEVTIMVSLKEDKTITLNYFINGQYCGTFSGDMTIDTGDIRALYINGWTYAANTGIMLDDIVMGYTANSHYVFDNQAHVVTPATCTEPETCSCGFTKGEALGHDYADATCTAPKTCKNGCGSTEGEALGHNLVLSHNDEAATLSCACGVTLVLDEYREWDGEGEDGKFAHSPNGKVDTVKEDGAWGFIFNPATEVAPGEGWYEYPDSKNPGHYGAQIQPWIPSNNRADALAGFSCENNAVGVISFDIKYNMTRHENRDTNFQLGVGKPRNASNWGDGGSWTDDQITILCIDDYSEDGILVRGGVNSSINLATIAVKDGWSEWFNVTIAIEMLDTGYMNTYYYINGVFCGSYSRDLSKADADGRFLNPKEIEAFQFSGWTYAANTGVMFDNMVFGYTAGGHNYLNGEDHETLAATCTEPERCSCGYVINSALGHVEAKATCTEDGVCSRCETVLEKATGHNLGGSAWDAEKNTFVYSCANNCGESYNLTGYYADGTDKNNLEVVNNGANYVLNINDAGQYEMLYPDETSDKPTGQQQIWVPLKGNPALLYDFSCANNAVGFLSFKVSGYNSYQNLQFKLNAERETATATAGPKKDFWSDCSFAVLDIKTVTSDSQTTVDVLGYGNKVIKTVEIGADKWTPWLDVAIKVELHDDNTMTLTYYFDGVETAVIEAAMPIYTHRITSVYINGRTSVKDSGFKFDDLAFGFVSGDNFYNTEIAADYVQDATLKTIVASKFKQCDQCTTVNAQGGTPVYVRATNGAKEVEALYVSRTYAWAGNEAEQFTEFRFDVDGTKKATKISFDYKIDGTVETNDRYTFKDLEGNSFSADAYVQIKTPSSHPLAGDSYPELSGTDLVLDGEWHTMTYEFDEPLAIINILLNLYHFQGEMLISNLVVEFEA